QHASRRNLTNGAVCTISRAEYIGTDRARRYASPGPAVPAYCGAALTTRPPGDTPGARFPPAAPVERRDLMDAILKPFPKPQLSDHVRAAPQPISPRPSREDAEAAVKTLIAFAGDDPAREGLRDTPADRKASCRE